MQVFISWSGEAEQIAVSLRKWIRDVLPHVHVWTSDKIRIGADWHDAVREHLEKARAGILLLTRGGLRSDWLLFEAGAIWLKTRNPLVYLIDITKDEVPAPLRKFQCASADEEGTWKLLKSLNRCADQHELDRTELRRRFHEHWPKFNSDLTQVRPVPQELAVHDYTEKA